MPIRFDHPALLWLLLLLIPVVALGWRSLGDSDRFRRVAIVLLRAAVVTLLVFMLAGMQAVRAHDELAVVALLDRSESVRRFVPAPVQAGRAVSAATAGPAPIEPWLSRWLAAASDARRADDRLGVVSFDGRPTVRSMPSVAPQLEAGTVETFSPGTDLAAAIRLGMALFPADASNRLLLISDGNDTQSNMVGMGAGNAAAARAAAYEARAAGVAIDVLPLAYELGREIMLQSFHAPAEAHVDQTISLRVVLSGSAPASGQLHVIHDGSPLVFDPEHPTRGRTITAEAWSAQPGAQAGRFVTVERIDVPLDASGVNHFEAVFVPDVAEADTVPINNRMTAFTLVHGQGRILYVDNVGPEFEGRLLPDVLRGRGMSLDVVSGYGVPTGLAEMQRYDAIIMQNEPAELVSRSQQQMLTRYVTELGGGLVVLGGPDSFGAGGWTHSPLAAVLPLELEIPSITVMPAGALVILLDCSGSMAEGVAGSMFDKQTLANRAAMEAINTLTTEDYVGVIGFNDGPFTIVPLAQNTDVKATIERVRRQNSGGGTVIFASLQYALDAMRRLDDVDLAVKHIILLTDGQGAGGNYERLLSDLREHNISLSTVGVGDGVDGALLAKLAMGGNGTYYPVMDPNTLPQIFIKEARVIRRALIKEYNFTPVVRADGSPLFEAAVQVPPLRGYVLTQPRQDPRIFLPMVAPDGVPLFAHWQVGLGKVAAFTSDATSRWAPEWLAWPGFADFWTRTVRNIARSAAASGFELATTLEGETLHLRLDATAAGEGMAVPSMINFLKVTGAVIRPDGELAPVTLRQTGPGIYEAELPAPEPGNYVVSLFSRDLHGEVQSAFGGVTRPPGPELRTFASNASLLEDLARITGGRVFDPVASEPAALFDHAGLEPTRSVRPIWRTLLVWTLVLLLLDVAARRIAWDSRMLGAVLAVLRSDPRGKADAAGTLAALKRRSRAIPENHPEAPAPTLSEVRARAAAQIHPRRGGQDHSQAAAMPRLEDAPQTRAGGPAARPPAQPRPAPPPPPATPDASGPTTSRLLGAKRRAQQQLEEERDGGGT